MATIRYAMTDDAIAQELGQRLAKLRVNVNITQDELANAVGIDRGRISRLEHSGAAKLSTVIAVLRHLDQLNLIERWLPEAPLVSPLQQMKAAMAQPKVRKRARKRKTTKATSTKDQSEGGLQW